MTEKRAAHRPSRRGEAVRAALRLQAASPQATVTVGQIAKEAGMTSAAVYYHYATREDVLSEGLADFSIALRAEIVSFLESGDPAALPAHLLAWFDQHRDAAVVWFVHSARMSMRVEAQRRETNVFAIGVLTKLLRTASGGIPLPHASVMAAALVSLIEVSARSWLVNEDGMVERRRDEFRAEVSELARRIVETRPPA